MNAEQIKLLEETIDHKNSKIPVALIADSPWIPGYCGHTFMDYYARNDVWMADNRKIRKDFPEEVIQIVKLLTHDGNAEYDNMTYFDYVRVIKNHPIARKVKLADIAHNSDQTRCVGSDLTEDKLAYWKDKYAKATKILMED